MIVLVMGVSGAGKTTIGRDLAARLGAVFLEGDDFHPPANVAKMARGEPLDDADRRPWLTALAAAIAKAKQDGRDAVVACSALKRRYRDILLGDRADCRIVHLSGDRDVIAAHLAARRGHYMPPGLLDSQLAALDPPSADEAAIVADPADPPAAIVGRVLAALPLATDRARAVE